MRHIRARHGAPWALHVSTFRPHPPWLASSPFAARYHHSQCGKAHRHESTQAEGAAHPWLADKLRDGPGGSNAPEDEDSLNMLRSQYLACCAEVDHSVPPDPRGLTAEKLSVSAGIDAELPMILILYGRLGSAV